MLGREYAQCFGQRVLLFRLFSIFGETQRRLLLWELFQQFSGPAEFVWLQGTGEETRDYLHAEDMASAVLLLIETQAPRLAESGLQVSNLASGVQTTVLDLAAQISELIPSHKEIRCHRLHRPGDPEHWQADVSYLDTLIRDWTPIPFPERLAQTLAAWQREAL